MSCNKVIIISAPSGAGKTTIVHYLLNHIPELSFSISACSRPPRSYEKNGQDYYFFSPQEFKKRIEDDAFLEWEEVYDNMFYGTLKQEIERLWSMNKVIIFDVDVKGGIALKNHFKEKSLSIFIAPPSLNTLEERLKNRGTESPESLALRLSKVSSEMAFKNEFDTIVVNHDLGQSCQKTIQLVKEFIL